jgi:hypothetical protein
MRTRKPIQTQLYRFLAIGLIATSHAPVVSANNLWSTPSSYLGTGYFFGPGAYMTPTPLFPAMIRNLSFISQQNFVTPFWNNGAEEPNVKSEKDFPAIDGKLSDGTKINENVDLGTFTLAGVRFLPAVGEGGEFFGQQRAMTAADGNVIMDMDLLLDLGIGAKGIIRIPFHGTTGVLTIPEPLTDPKGAPGAKQAGLLKTGETISGRVGDFNNDGFIDGTLVAIGVMPLSSPVYPGQPFAMSRNFETDIPIEGALYGAPKLTNKAYGLPPDARGKEVK